MIDLTKKALPNTVTVDGTAFSIYTDFRLWMRFEIEAERMKPGESIEIGYLFKNERPAQCDIRDLFAFSRPHSELPRPSGRESGVKALDYRLDADLIYAAFLGQYGIDLIETDMHWHKFLALLGGINDSTKLQNVIQIRCYKRDTRKDVDHREELKRLWEIEPELSEEEEAELEEFSNIFTPKE